MDAGEAFREGWGRVAVREGRDQRFLSTGVKSQCMTAQCITVIAGGQMYRPALTRGMVS